MELTASQPRVPGPAPNGHLPTDAAAPPPPPSPKRARTRTMVVVAILVLVLLGAALVLRLVERSRRNRDLASAATQAATTPPETTVVHPVPAGALDWSLPGTTQAIQDATIYARVSGYLRKRYVDLGDNVKAGQLLAEIESPELEQQLMQARANLEQAKKQLDVQNANLELARATMERYKGADQEGAVAKLAVDQAVAGYGTALASVAAAQATVDSNEANVRQYEALTAFERVLAPFDGLVIQRNVDVGALITAGSPINNTGAAPTGVTGAATGLFEVAQIDTLRVFVSVPQVVAPNLTVGMPAQITVRGALTAPVAATVTRTANALDPSTRTLLTEVDIPNPPDARRTLPGEFVYVAFRIAPSGQRWNLPATALIFNADGAQVMVVDPGGKLRVHGVTVGRDFGKTIDVQAGLTGGETIVEQPGVSMQNGQIITPVEAKRATKE
jgi:membrane fusion protein (multidrug efflux system)